jgi:hypothetical protein
MVGAVAPTDVLIERHVCASDTLKTRSAVLSSEQMANPGCRFQFGIH